MSSIIKLVDIKKTYHTGEQVYEALKGVYLTIERGEMASIMGASGAGKSTLMNIIGLLDKPTSGQYYLDDKEVAHLSDDEHSRIRSEKIGFVFQSFYLLPKLTALQNVTLPTIYHPEKMSDIKERALLCLEKVGMKQFYHHKPNQLSGGQQQRVAIARALMCSPKVILADEPTGALDSKTSQEVMNLFGDLNKQEGVTVIIVTHDVEVGNQCERIIRVKDGKIADSTDSH